jgi:transposase
LIGDKAYDSDRLDRDLMTRYGIQMISLHRGRRRKPSQDGWSLRRYRKRWRLERLFAWHHHFRRLVIRWEYHIENFFGMVRLGCIKLLLGNFMLLDVIGVAAPMDLYAQIAADGPERFSGLIHRNDELVASILEKSAVVALLKRSLQAVNQSFAEASDGELDRRLHFIGEETTVRRVYLRLLAHTHEHMGQMIAYLRFNDIAPPWLDWRPDRRSQN